MKTKNRVSLWICLSAVILASCSSETPLVSLGIDSNYHITRMKKLALRPAFTGKEYRWTIRLNNGLDSTVSTEKDYVFVAAHKGTYKLSFFIDGISDSTQIDVYDEEVAYSPYISGIDDYHPAPGQYVNTIPEYASDDTQKIMNEKCLEAIGNNAGGLITLGSYGGYVTFHFDHTIANVSGEKDFSIFGNAYFSSVTEYSSKGGNAEPGIVEVAFDKNMNGVADDDEWYELAGSEYANSLHNYQITYTRNNMKNISWTDNRDSTGMIVRNTFHSQEYFPQWMTDEQLTFKGSLLPKNGVDCNGSGTLWILYMLDWGYVDNYPNSYKDKCSFDISWAVDKNGNSVKLPGADFIRVYTGENQTCGWIGETSTEVSGAEDLHVNQQ
jgi:hypothetical protein